MRAYLAAIGVCIGLAATLVLALVVGAAHLFGGGHVLVHVHEYGEGGPEVALLVAAAPLQLLALVRLARGS